MWKSSEISCILEVGDDMKKVTRKTRKFKGIEENPSLLGFGCMRFPTISKDRSDIDEPKAKRMIDYAFEHGVNYFDTAYPYHSGQSETFIGKVLKTYARDQFYLASKMPTWLIESVDDAKRIFYEQLKNCQVDHFDYYLCHALNKNNRKAYDLPGVMDFLYDMKREGKIGKLGFSFHDTPDVLESILAAHTWDFVQIQLNYLDWTLQDAKKQYELIESHGIPCIVMEPVRGGLLASLCEDSAEILQRAKPDQSIASWAIRYAASKDNVMVVLSGMSNLEQTKDNIATMTSFKPIDRADQEVLDRAVKVFVEKRTIPCTDCKYCMPCSEGVDIPAVFAAYNAYAIAKNEFEFVRAYERIQASCRANQCISCGACLSKCPQHIEIPENMGMIDDLYQAIMAKSR
jgi:uncharacterized protein